MVSTFFRFPVSSKSASIKLDSSKISEFYPWDTDALAFWDFSNESFRSVDATQLLTAKNPASPPTFNSGKLVFSTAAGNSIASKLTDEMLPAHSYTAVVYIPDMSESTQLLMIAGNYQRLATPTGEQMMCSGRKFLVSTSSFTGNYTSAADTVEGWCFVSIAVDIANKKMSCYMTQISSGAEIAVEDNGGRVYPHSAAPFGLGNDNYTSNTASKTIQASEFVIYDKYMTLAELKNKYTAAKNRQKNLGVNI